MTNMLLLLFVYLGLVSCTEHRLYSEISRQFGGKDTITVRMADIVRQQWDTMYVFQPMSHHLGLEHYHDYPYYHDIGRRIVFVKDGAVVFREDEIAVEWPYSITFDNYCYAFTPETAVFRAVRVTEDISRKYIELHSMKEPNTDPVWSTDFIDGEWQLIRGNRLDSIPHAIDTLITIWNRNKVAQLSLYSVKPDTAYVKVEAEYAFTRFGTTGAERTLASIVFTLTEDERYPNIVLQFDTTEHASPGVYSRDYFREIFFIQE